MATFSDLPAEVRNMVYDVVFEPPSLSRSTPNSCNALAIFAASKQIHREATSHFYQKKEFTVDTSAAPANHATLLPPIADKYLRFLKQLTINTAAGPSNLASIRKASRTLTALTTMGAELRTLSVVVVSPLSHLLSSRVDDSIMDTSHPITQSLRDIVNSGITESITVDLVNSHFAPDVAKALQIMSHNRLSFSINGDVTDDWSSIERPLCGRYSTSHLFQLGLATDDIAHSRSDASSYTSSTPSSLASSTGTVFAELDHFSVTSFEMSGDEEMLEQVEEPFFKDEDIEDWSAATEDSDSLFEYGMDEEMTDANDDKNDNSTKDTDSDSIVDNIDDEMELIPTTEMEHIVRNIDETAHHVANDADITYMTNFAPLLLLSRHQLGHLR